MVCPLLLRRHAWALPCFGLIAALYFTWTATDQIGYFANDAPSYLMMARHYSLFGHESTVNAEAATYAHFPPLYPMLLALGGTGGELYPAHLVTTAFLLAGLAAYYAWLVTVGAGTSQAALLVLLVALLPGSWLQALGLMSESLYLFWSLLALSLLTLCERPALRTRRNELLCAAALAVAGAELTRTIGIALLLPLALAAWRAPRRIAALAVGLALVPALAWQLVHHSHLGYGEALGGIYGPAWRSELRHQLATELPALRDGFIQDLAHAPAAWRPLLEGLGVVLLAGVAGRALRLKPDGTYVAAYLGVILLWPYPEEAWRFLWVLLPITLFQWLLVLGEALRMRADAAHARLGTAALALVLLTSALPSLAFAARRYHAASEPALVPARGFASWYELDPARAISVTHGQLALIAAMHRIRDKTPADACVIALRADLINYFSDRRSVLPPFNATPDPLYQRLLRAPGCRYVFMSTMTRGSMYPLPLYPLNRLGSGARILDYAEEPDPPPATGRAIAILAELDGAPSSKPP